MHAPDVFHSILKIEQKYLVLVETVGGVLVVDTVRILKRKAVCFKIILCLVYI